MSGHDTHGSQDAHGHGPSGYEPPKDISTIVLVIPPVLGVTLITTVIFAVLWF